MMTMAANSPPSSSATVLRLLLGADLRQLRERHGLTADALGARIGSSGSAVCRWEAGNRLPRPEPLSR